jgi:hypothetical protein
LQARSKRGEEERRRGGEEERRRGGERRRAEERRRGAAAGEPWHALVDVSALVDGRWWMCQYYHHFEPDMVDGRWSMVDGRCIRSAARQGGSGEAGVGEESPAGSGLKRWQRTEALAAD